MVFFIGVASIIEKAGARFSHDTKAMEIISKAKAAIGGENNIAKVKSMSIVAKTTHYFGDEGKEQQGGMEINFALPNRYSKMIKIGAPGKTNDGDVRKEVNVIMMNGDTDSSEIEVTAGGKDKKGVFLIRKSGDGEEDFEDIEIKGDKIIIKKKDGTTEEIDKNSDKVKKIVINEDSDGSNTWTTEDGKEIIVKKRSGGKTKWKTTDGKTIEIITDAKVGPEGMQDNEILRTTISLLLTPPEGMNVEYKFLGEGNVDGSKTNIVGITMKENSFKLHIDASSNLPSMLSFNGRAHRVMVFKEKGESTEKLMEIKAKMADAKDVEHQVKFSDFKTVGGLKLPHQWSESADGKKAQSVSVTSYKINPSDIEDKFKHKKVYFKKKMKSDK